MTASSPVEDKVRTRDFSGICASDPVRREHVLAVRSLLEDEHDEQGFGEDFGGFVPAPTYVGQGLVTRAGDRGIGLRVHARETRT
mgnify:CR=1 FL=1